MNHFLRILAASTVVAVGLLAFIHLASVISDTYGVRYVATSSMWPAIPQTSVIVYKKHPFSFAVGDVVVYHYRERPDIVIVHRVIGFDAEKNYVLIKGDNATWVDIIPREDIDGVVLLAIPYLGYPRLFIHVDPLGFTIIAFILIMIVLFPVLKQW